MKHLGRYFGFYSELRRYERLPGAGKVPRRDLHPCFGENTASTGFDSHYFYQDIWAFRKIVRSGAAKHVDVGSRVDYVGFLTAVTNVTFIDIRPLQATLENLRSLPGSILSIPFPDGSVESLSCLHVAEHIGLGRYGDPLDPLGTVKACAELRRCLAPGGCLYFALPIGKPRVCFNAHRIHSCGQILEYFEGLRLVEFSFVDDGARFTVNADMASADGARYGCGLFHFVKPAATCA